MNTADILHDTAMDYYDLGKIAKAKGKHSVYMDYLHKAYILGKEAAIKKQQDVEDQFWKYVYLRSAAWLAIDCQKWAVATQLAKFGLQGTPPITEKKQFEEILKKAHPKTPQTKLLDKDIKPFIGVLTSADMTNSFIIINGGQPTALKIRVPANKVDELVRLFWGNTIEGNGILMENGELELREIQKAA